MPLISIFISILLLLTSQTQSRDVYQDGDILAKVNALREKGCSCNGKKMPPAPPLKWSETLEETAFNHARDMAKRAYFSHITPDGVDVGERVRNAGYNWAYVGENIAQGQKHFDQVLEDWIVSPVHCKLLMNPNFAETAVARFENKWVQHFGRKLE